MLSRYLKVLRFHETSVLIQKASFTFCSIFHSQVTVSNIDPTLEKSLPLPYSFGLSVPRKQLSLPVSSHLIEK